MFTPSGGFPAGIHLFEPERFKIWTAKVVIFRRLANKLDFYLDELLFLSPSAEQAV